MAAGDGNGWVDCRCGRRHWGRFGAAGLLLVKPAATDGDAPDVLLQLRAAWTHEGGTWGIPGGAVDSHEDGPAGALRETHEETDVPADAVRVVHSLVTTDHEDWTYTSVIGLLLRPVSPVAITAESDAVRWVDVDEVSDLPLHAGFAASWPRLRSRVHRS